MKYEWINRHIHYDGSQLSSHWIRHNTGIQGDAIIAFMGSCDVEPARMVDVEDIEKGHIIRARKMLHFIVEIFRVSILEAVLAQRLLVAITAEILQSFMPGLHRDGDDLFVNEGKLSVSIATVSPVSGLIHLGLNIDAKGAPVTAATLPARPEPRQLADKIAQRFCREYVSAVEACTKVRWVS